MPSNKVQSLSWIETPDVCRGDARTRNTHHTVAGLVQSKRLGLLDDQILERHPDLSPADLETAWAHLIENADDIDQSMRKNEDA